MEFCMSTDIHDIVADGKSQRVDAKEKRLINCHQVDVNQLMPCLLYTSPSPRDRTRSRMPSSA